MVCKPEEVIYKKSSLVIYDTLMVYFHWPDALPGATIRSNSPSEKKPG